VAISVAAHFFVAQLEAIGTATSRGIRDSQRTAHAVDPSPLPRPPI
jgi:hypothetical protein